MAEVVSFTVQIPLELPDDMVKLIARSIELGLIMTAIQGEIARIEDKLAERMQMQESRFCIVCHRKPGKQCEIGHCPVHGHN